MNTDMSTAPLLTAQDGFWGSGQQVIVYTNRYEHTTRRFSTMFLTKKRETYPFSQIRDIEVKGGTLTVRLGPMTVRRYQLGRRNAKKAAEIIRQHM